MIIKKYILCLHQNSAIYPIHNIIDTKLNSLFESFQLLHHPKYKAYIINKKQLLTDYLYILRDNTQVYVADSYIIESEYEKHLAQQNHVDYKKIQTFIELCNSINSAIFQKEIYDDFIQKTISHLSKPCQTILQSNQNEYTIKSYTTINEALIYIKKNFHPPIKYFIFYRNLIFNNSYELQRLACFIAVYGKKVVKKNIKVEFYDYTYIPNNKNISILKRFFKSNLDNKHILQNDDSNEYNSITLPKELFENIAQAMLHNPNLPTVIYQLAGQDIAVKFFFSLQEAKEWVQSFENKKS